MGIFDKIFGNKEEENTSSGNELEWLNLSSESDLDAAIETSKKTPVVLFKHSTRCSISSSALGRLQRNWNGEEVDVKMFYLDLIAYREISNAIAQKLDVMHQSPQMIILKDGKAVFSSTHMEIDFNDIKAHASAK